jgi:hypothetical protein
MDKNSGYDNTFIANISNAKFLRMVTDNTWSRRIHVEQIRPKESAVFHAIGSVKPNMSQEAMKMV